MMVNINTFRRNKLIRLFTSTDFTDDDDVLCTVCNWIFLHLSV